MVATLLALALQVIMMAQQPDVSLAQKNDAIQIATLAINFAQNSFTTSQSATATPVSPSFGGITPQKTCIENPSLTLIPSTTSVDHVNGTYIYFHGTYSTGCPVDQNIKWNFKAINSKVGSERGNLTAEGDDMVFYGESGNFVNSTTTYSLTVGITTQEVIVGAY